MVKTKVFSPLLPPSFIQQALYHTYQPISTVQPSPTEVLSSKQNSLFEGYLKRIRELIKFISATLNNDYVPYFIQDLKKQIEICEDMLRDRRHYYHNFLDMLPGQKELKIDYLIKNVNSSENISILKGYYIYQKLYRYKKETQYYFHDYYGETSQEVDTPVNTFIIQTYDKTLLKNTSTNEVNTGSSKSGVDRLFQERLKMNLGASRGSRFPGKPDVQGVVDLMKEWMQPGMERDEANMIFIKKQTEALKNYVEQLRIFITTLEDNIEVNKMSQHARELFYGMKLQLADFNKCIQVNQLQNIDKDKLSTLIDTVASYLSSNDASFLRNFELYFYNSGKIKQKKW